MSLLGAQSENHSYELKRIAIRGFVDSLTPVGKPAWLPMLVFAGFFWLSSAMYISSSHECRMETHLLIALLGLALCIACSLVLLGRGSNLLFIAILGTSLGLAVSSFASYGQAADMNAIGNANQAEWDLLVVEDSKSGEFGSSCLVKCVLPGGQRVKVRVNLPDGREADCWEVIHASGRLSEPSGNSLVWYWRKGCVASISPSDISISEPKGFFGLSSLLRDKASCVIDESFKTKGSFDDSRVLLKAILLGDRRGLFESDLYDVMKRIGLAHIVAVSGAHLVMLTGFLILLLQVIGIPKRMCVPVQLASIIVYACMTGLPVSVLRAAIMSTCALLSFFAKRGSSSLTALSLCVVGMIAWDPFLSVSVSLAMSACASLGIMLLSPGVSKVLSDLLSSRFRLLCDSLSVCLSANALTLPISIPTFGQVPLIAPISNLLAVPAFPFIVCYGAAAIIVSCLVPRLLALVMLPLQIGAQLFCGAARFLSNAPYACIPASGSIVVLGLLAGLLVVAFLALQKVASSRAIGISLLAAASVFLVIYCAKPYLEGEEVIALDVGQGDAILVRDGPRSVLVDTGTNDADLLSGLSRHSVRKLDAVIITHPDDDHCGSLNALASVMPIGIVCVTDGVLDLDKESSRKLLAAIGDCEIVTLSANDSISLGCYSLDVLSPSGLKDDGGNSDSLVIEVSADMDDDGEGDWSILLTGDAEAGVLIPLLRQGKLGDVDVLKVPHHGSKDAVSRELLEGLRPEVAIISVGEGNRYGHPSDVTQNQLRESGARILRTDSMGDVVCKLNSKAIRIECIK